MKRTALLTLASLLVLGTPAAGQFISPLPSAELLSPSDYASLFAKLHPDEDFAAAGSPEIRWFFPMFVGGREVAKEIYSTVGYGLFGTLDTNLSGSESLTTVDIVAGAVGVLPFGIRTAFVIAKGDTATAMTESGPTTVEGTRSDLTALIRNGGNVAGRLAFPIFLTKGPNVRSALSVAVELGALGNLAEPDSLRGSGTIGLDLGVALSIRELTGDGFLGDFLIPVRLGYAGSSDTLEPGVIDRKGFGFLQIGAGLTNEDGQFRLAVLWSRPFAPEVRDRSPTFLVNFSAALQKGG